MDEKLTPGAAASDITIHPAITTATHPKSSTPTPSKHLPPKQTTTEPKRIPEHVLAALKSIEHTHPIDPWPGPDQPPANRIGVRTHLRERGIQDGEESEVSYEKAHIVCAFVCCCSRCHCRWGMLDWISEGQSVEYAVLLLVRHMLPCMDLPCCGLEWGRTL